MQAGVYVAADVTYWVAGADIMNAQQVVEVLPYGAIPKSACLSDNKETAVWYSVKGVVMADIQGQVKNLQEQALALNITGTSGACMYNSDESRVIAVANA
jgi:hypothetical protein